MDLMIIVGEKINASRPGVREIIEQRNAQGLVELAQRQADAGARYIDVNVGTGSGSREDEIAAMDWAVRTVAEAVDKPLSVDSADPGVLEAGLKAVGDRSALINSTKAEPEILEPVVGLAARFGSPLVGLAMDETGIPVTVEGRIDACRKIVSACEKHRVPIESIFFDPLVLPVSTDVKQGRVTLETISRVKEEFPAAKTVMGLSNISFGLPARGKLNAAFLHMAVLAGLDAAIADPLDTDLMAAVTVAEVLVGKDRHCRKYTRAFRGR